MGRGGYRKNAGAKSSWKHGKTKTIRVPIALADEVLRLARLLDEGQRPGVSAITEFDTNSKVLDLSGVSVPRFQGRPIVFLSDVVRRGYQIAPPILQKVVAAEMKEKLVKARK